MLQVNSKRILAALSAAVFISSMCSAQIRTVPNTRRVPRVDGNIQVTPPAGTIKPGNTTTPSTAPNRTRPGSTTEATTKPVTLPTKSTTIPAKINPGLQKRSVIDLSAKLPQLRSVSVSMICATSDTAAKSVILKWVIDNEWLPDQGYNLYRKGPGETDFKKIAGPIKENPSAASITLPAINGVIKTVNIAVLQKQARANVQIPANMMRAFAPAPTNVETSKPVFDELKELRFKSFTPIILKTRSDFSVVKPESFLKLNGYSQKFSVQKALQINGRPGASVGSQNSGGVTTKSLKTAGIGIQRLAPIAKSPAQITVESRRALIMGALVNKSVCDALGLGYVDSAVTDGQTYDYQLRRITGSGDVETAGKCTIIVGADPLPSKPSDLSACQLDVHNVAIRWKLDDSKTSARVISYCVYRTQNGKRQLLNAQPLMVGPVQDSEGKYTDPIYYFTDKNVPVGDIQYELVGVDAFGRQSAPATLGFSMADWETPQSINQVTCAVNNGQVYLYWQPSLKATKIGKPVSDDAAMYNVYRFDQESSKVWTKLNDEPIKPSYIAPPTLGKQYAMKLAMIKKVSNLSFIDKTCKDDAYYLYTVVAVYKKNMIESAPSPSQTVGVPDLDPPAKVASFAGKHVALVSQLPQLVFDARWVKASSRPLTPVAKIKNLSFDPSTLIAKPVTSQNTSTAAKPLTLSKTTPAVGLGLQKTVATQNIGHTSLVKLAADLIKATTDNSDLGGKVVLTWEASSMKAPVRYKIYRSSGTGFRVTGGFDKLAVSPVTVKSLVKVSDAAMAVPAALPRAVASYQYMAAKPADLRITPAGKQTNLPAIHNKGISLEFIKRVDLSAIAEDSYQLLGETKSAAYSDCLPKSRPMYYNYRVVPINRWGVEGNPAVVQVRVGATMPPPTPEVVSAYPNSDGGVTLSLKPLENKDECAKYVVYRKQIDVSLIIKNIKPVAIIAKAPVIASRAPAAVAKPSEPLTFSSDMKIAPLSAVISPSVASKALDHGMRMRPILSFANAEFSKNLRQILAKTDYEVVGEIGANEIDKNGYVRYNDLKGLSPNQLYSYTVMAVDVDTWKSAVSKPETASPWKVTVPPINNLKAAASGNGIVISWTAPAGEIMGYAVLKGVAKNTEFVQISDTIKPTTFTDFSVIKGRTYTYRVQAVDSLGNLSEPISVEFALPK